MLVYRKDDLSEKSTVFAIVISMNVQGVGILPSRDLFLRHHLPEMIKGFLYTHRCPSTWHFLTVNTTFPAQIHHAEDLAILCASGHAFYRPRFEPPPKVDSYITRSSSTIPFIKRAIRELPMDLAHNGRSFGGR